MLFIILFLKLSFALVTSRPKCQSGYKAYNQTACFKVVYSKRLSILQKHAARACEDSFGTLASFDNGEQERFTSNLLNNAKHNASNYQLWIGYRRNKYNRLTFEWMDNSTSKYTNWRPKEPNNQDEECVHAEMLRAGGYKGWNDLPCTHKDINGFICRAPLLGSILPAKSRFDDSFINEPPMFVHQMNPSIIYFVESSVKINSYPENLNKAKFYCQANGSPNISYGWLKNGRPFDISDKKLSRRIFQVPNEGTIFLNQLTSTDEGIYNCIAKNKFGNRTDHPIELKRAFINNFTNTNIVIFNITAGDPFAAHCQPPKSVPPAKLHWILTSSTKSPYIKPINSPNIVVNDNGSIFFQYVTDVDKNPGYYFTCVAENDVLSAYQTGSRFTFGEINLPFLDEPMQGNKTIFKLVKQYISPAELTVVKNGTLELFCIYSGYLNYFTLWRKLGTSGFKTISHGLNLKSIKIDRVTEDDAGTYKCFTPYNHSNTFNVTVESAPIWREELPQIFDSSEGLNIGIRCDVGGSPTPTITFYKSGSSIVSKDRISVQGDQLLIRDLKKDDKGVYQCEAENKHGRLRTAFYINIA